MTNPKYPIVTDGVVQIEILETIGKTEEWLIEDELKKKDLTMYRYLALQNNVQREINVVTY